MIPHHPVPNTLSTSRQGFALILALSMMAFVLLLVLSITTLTQVETRAAHTHLQTVQARENARLALMLAIGQLQTQASHDQRVTARAEILGEDAYDPAARFWTGVWNTKTMSAGPVWLVSGTNANPGAPVSDQVRIVGPGTVGDVTTQYVYVPAIRLFDTSDNVSGKIAWWIGDEGVKASVASLPLHQRPIPNFLTHDNSLQLQLASTHGLKSIFNQYDRFSSTSSELLDRLSTIDQLEILEAFNKSAPHTSGEALFHTLTLNSCGVLAGTTDSGLMQDLSLFPALLGPGLQAYLQLAETHANQLANQTQPVAQKQLSTDIVGLEAIGAASLQTGDIATPIIPVLSNFMIAFTIRSKEDALPDDNFLLRARFFCEFWNPYTHTLSMKDQNDDPIDLELEITGFPKVTVHGDLDSSNPIDLQTLMADPDNDDGTVVIRLINDPDEPWLPGRSKNWVGLETVDDPVHSPYRSVDTQSKKWYESYNTLGGDEGIDTGEPRFPGNLYHTSDDDHTLRIKTYQVTTSSRKLISDLNGFLYEPVSTRPEGYDNTHRGATFGYHINLREPHHSNDHPDFFRGVWLKDNDLRNPMPQFPNDSGNWYASVNTDSTGSPYISVKDGFVPINTPEPHQISEAESTINTVCFQRLLDRSKISGRHFHKLWQDAPLFELPRRRILSLAALQHIYIHNERPFQVGNSWGNEGAQNTSAWFDHYYFSGLSRNDEPDDFNWQAGPVNPCLQFVNTNRFLAQFPLWKEALPNDPVAAREPAQNFMVANRFNINSTSVDAWKAVLSSLRLKDFSHLHWPNGRASEQDIPELLPASREHGSFTRFSHSLEETYQAPAPPVIVDSNPVAPSAFYRHGARRFSDDQFEAFAREIVRLIRQKGTPFESMEAFLSELSSDSGSLLEQAIMNVFTDPITGRQQWRHIWETTGEHTAGETPVDIDHFSPGFLTQADIMTAIGPMLSPRSDTFKIRARGESFSPQGKAVGSATIEAIVQRIPEAADPGVAIESPTQRKLKLISMRWLADGEV